MDSQLDLDVCLVIQCARNSKTKATGIRRGSQDTSLARALAFLYTYHRGSYAESHASGLAPGR